MYPFVYIASARLRATPEFLAWLEDLRDKTARARILLRLRRLGDGHPGDFSVIESDLRELRLHFGPGYRVYYAHLGGGPVLLLGGDKWSQLRDIAAARALLSRIRGSM
jgi:putative addiction module killer protein